MANPLKTKLEDITSIMQKHLPQAESDELTELELSDFMDEFDKLVDGIESEWE